MADVLKGEGKIFVLLVDLCIKQMSVYVAGSLCHLHMLWEVPILA